MKDFRRPSGQGREKKSFERRDSSAGFRTPRPNEHRAGYEGYQGAHQSERREETLHKATCAECQKTCEVPFRPNGKKPVYCKDCFGAHKAPAGERPNMGSANRFEKSEFTPRPPAPQAAYNREDRPQAQPSARDARIDVLAAQVDALHTKMDRMLKAMEGSSASAAKPEAKPEIKAAPKAAEVKKVPAKTAPVVAKKPMAAPAVAAKKPAAKPAAKAKAPAKKK